MLLSLVCFSGLQFPSPYALSIKPNYIQLCSITITKYSIYKPDFLCLWLLIYCFLLRVSVTLFCPDLDYTVCFLDSLINAALESS